MEGDNVMNKLSEGLLALAEALENLAHEHETEVSQQKAKLDYIEQRAESTRAYLKSFAEDILRNL